MHILVILDLVGRIVAGIIGGVALYIGIFMYSDEKQRWQNRLEMFWLGVYDRAKNIDSVFIALVNRVSGSTVKVFGTLFGEETFSLKLVAVSVNLSFAVATFIRILPNVAYYIVVPSVARVLLLTAVASLLCVFMATKYKSNLLYVCYLLPVVGASLYRVAVVYGILRNIGYDSFMSNPRFARYELSLEVIVPMLMVVSSCAVDAMAVIVIRKRFSELQKAVTSTKVFSGVAMLLLVSVIAYVVPREAGLTILSRHPYVFGGTQWSNEFFSYISAGLIELGRYDVVTAIYCLIPCLVLVGLVLHKIMWPLLAKATYPLLDFKVIQERKIIIPIGTAALGYAFGGEYIVLKIIEKLG